MSTTRQYIGQVFENLNINSDDNVIDERLIIDLINNNFSVAKRNEYNRLRSIDDSAYQIIPCFEMEIVEANLCCGELITGCKILRSKERLPDVIELHQKDGIDFIKPNLLTAPNINYVTIDRIPYIKSDTISARLLYAFILDSYLYLYSANENYLLIDSVLIRAMFTDPFLAGSVGCNADSCFNLDSTYPGSEWMWQTLVKPQVINELMNRHMLARDNEPNGKDETEEIIMQQKEEKIIMQGIKK